MKSGLYDRLVRESLLIPHREIKTLKTVNVGSLIIEPVEIPFISYPYEWCFSQLKDAALITLKIQKIAIEYGMILRDASSFNIQMYNGKPIFIDTLSFAIYEEGKPWFAYKQFCEHFLAPMSLIAYVDSRLSRLLHQYLDGIPLDLAVRLLPWTKKLHQGLLLHLVFHSHSQKHRSKIETGVSKLYFPKSSLMGLITSLESTVRSIKWTPRKTMWSQYNKANKVRSYRESSLLDKKKIVEKYLKASRSKYIWDLGANTGEFSRLASTLGIFVVSIDNDASVIENQYRNNIAEKINNILPLCIDILNPTPGLGWRNLERESFLNRPKPDAIMALAIIHHLAIGANIPLSNLAETLFALTDKVIIEFVPKTDPQVEEMLRLREDIFPGYTQAGFESAFGKYFSVVSSEKISDSKRTLYLLKRKK